MSISVDRSKRLAASNLARAEADLCEAIAGVAVYSARRKVVEATTRWIDSYQEGRDSGLDATASRARATALASERVWEEIAAERNAERDADAGAGSASEVVA